MLNWFRRPKVSRTEEAAGYGPILVVTPAARAQLAAVLGRQAEPAAVRILVKNPGGSPTQYDMALEPAASSSSADTMVDVGGVQIRVDPMSLPVVRGATLD